VPSLVPRHREREDVLRIAHRGADAGSIAEIERQVRGLAEVGAHFIEVDVRITRDGRLVVSHDAVVLDAGRHRRWIWDMSYGDLVKGLGDAPPHSFDAVAQVISNSGVGMYCDIKSLNESSAATLGSIVTELNLTHRTVFGSQRGDLLKLVGEVAPEVPRAILLMPTSEDAVELAGALGATFVHPCWERKARPDRIIGGAWIERVRRNGLGVICWHEERPSVIEALYVMGVDGICTDNTPLLTHLAASHGVS
jgi:glycerophosphoryl diester phosphodiesterase